MSNYMHTRFSFQSDTRNDIFIGDFMRSLRPCALALRTATFTWIPDLRLVQARKLSLGGLLPYTGRRLQYNG
jgi:hypothetical protein